MANPLWDWACKAFESWPVIGTSLKDGIEAPWKDDVDVDKTAGPGKPSQMLFQFIFSPDTFYKSELGRSLVDPAADGKDFGLLGADSQTKLANAQFIDRNGPFLSMIDPLWKSDKPGMRTFDQDVHDMFTKYVNGRTKTADLPPAIRNEAASVKQWMVDRYNGTDNLKKLGPGGAWVLDDDIVGPTVKELFNKDNPNVGQYGLSHIVPKEISYKIIEQGSAKDVSGIDWLRAAAPMVNRKNQFDPVIQRMRDAMGQLPDVERQYTERLLNRLTGRRTSVQNGVDTMINSVRFAFGGGPINVSPSAQYAAGITKTFYNSLMLYNPGMALLHLSQSLNVLAKEGEMVTLQGLKNFMTNEGRELAAERKFLGDMDRFYYSQSDQTALQKGMEKFEHFGYKMFDTADFLKKGLGFHAGLARFMNENGIGSLKEFMSLKGTDTYNQGMLQAMSAANETGFLFGVVHQSPTLSTPLAKLVAGQFMSFPIRQTEFIMKQFRSGNYMFLPRFMFYTGAASSMAYYGMNLAIGKHLGGLGSVPEAMDLLKAGKTSDALWTAGEGLFKYLPDRDVLTGLTPFGGLIHDTLGLLSDDPPEEKWAKFGRTASLVLPAGLEMRRVLEGALVQYGQEGARYKPQGFSEGLSIPVALSKAAKEIFGDQIPGVSTRFTGSLERQETPGETFKATIGVRSADAEMQQRIMEINKTENQQTTHGMAQFSTAIANALIDGTPDDLSKAFDAAASSGLFANTQALHQSIENAMRERQMTSQQRQEKNSPKSLKLKRAGL